MSSQTPPPVPQHEPPPVPQHAQSRGSTITTTSTASTARPQRPGGAIDNGLRRSSALSVRRQSTLGHGDSVDEDAVLLRESVNASRILGAEPRGNIDRLRDSWAGPPANNEFRSGGGRSTEPITRAKTAEPLLQDDDSTMFDYSIAEAANAAMRFQERPLSPPKPPSRNKVMTPAQFERYRQEQERLRSIGGVPKEEENDEDYDEDEHEVEKQKAQATQRRKQEAHMAVYRQQMMKVTGEAPSLQRPGIFASQSTPNLTISRGSDGGEDEDEDVPLAVLAAHGFPNKNRQPSQLSSMASIPNLSAAATQSGQYAPPPGSVAGGSTTGVPGGRLPVFARGLPQDPYFGAGLVNPISRESLAMGSGTGSAYGGTRGQPGQPGGLVGVIANEERSRALRRGSPNTAGEYPSLPANAYGGMGMAPGSSMVAPNGQMYPGMMIPADQAQVQISQQLSQFMSMQMQFMQMMATGQQQPSQGPPTSQGNVSATGAPQIPRSATMGNMSNIPVGDSNLRPGSSSHNRALTAINPNAAPWVQSGQPERHSMFGPTINVQGTGYTPSIAPSERSNIGQPGRYRPVSHMPVDKNRTSTMSGALGGWTGAENKNPATVRVVAKARSVSDDEDDEGWEEMRRKREAKKRARQEKKGVV